METQAVAVVLPFQLAGLLLFLLCTWPARPHQLMDA